jgi:catechol 2,3-dioxygenase-like lactoylglutathione lyase family enzyme
VSGGLHHVEVWVPDLAAAEASWSWLLGALGWEPYQNWPAGRSWRLGEVYLVIEQSPALTRPSRDQPSADRPSHDRCAPGLNHLAFHAGTRADVDDLTRRAPGHGWSLLFPDRHPFAGGPEHYAAYLEDRHGYEVELVAGG